MTDFDELMIRIPTETAILFLGQEFDKNTLFNACAKKYKQLAFGEKEICTYSEAINNLTDYCEDNPIEKSNVVSNLLLAENSISDNRFERLASLPWSGVVTSMMHAMPGFNSLHSVVRSVGIKADYFSKKNLKMTYLFGRVGNDEANIPLSYEDQMKSRDSMNQIWREISDRIKLRGILVVDSWDPQNDWLTENDFNAFISCPKHSIFFFNLSEEAKNKRQIRQLLSKGIAVVIEGNLYDWLCKSDIETQKYFYDYEDNEDDSIGITIDSLLDKAEYSTRRLEFSILNQLDKSILVLDDTVLDNPNYIDRKEYFIRFLSTENYEPLWGGYTSGFYFERDIDNLLFEKVEQQIKNNDPAKNKVILIEGRNASGKSACLGYLAYRLRMQKRYPVIYITSEMRDRSRFEQLFNLIRNHINEKLGARKTVVIWDRNTYDNDEIYDELRKNLEECNVVLVGSKYIIGDVQENKNKNIDIVPLKEELSDKEVNKLKKVLRGVTPEYERHCDDILRTIENISNTLSKSRKNTVLKTYSDNGNWFLMIMYRLFEDLHKIQQNSVKRETQSAEDAFIEWLKEYSSDKFSNCSFKKLYEDLGFDYQDKSDEYKRLVSEMYNMIAVAGKYGLELPAMVIYRAFANNYAQDWGEFSNRIGKSSVIKMMQYEDGALTFRFRRSLMASLFLEDQVQQDNDFVDKGLMDIEVQSLMKIIENTNFNNNSDDSFNESMQVMNLIRKFGPNGPETMKYKDYYIEIADVLNKSNQDMNDEAILVSSHLVREAFNGNPNDPEENKPLLEARAKLKKAINRYGRYDKSQQLSRLKVEISSNLLKSIQTEGYITEDEFEIFKQINEYLDDAMAIDLNRFSAGVFLDANLKVYPLVKNEAQKDKMLSRMLQIVDDVKDASYNDFGEKFSSKILNVLDLAKRYEEFEEENARLVSEGSDIGIYRKAMIALDGYFFNEVPNVDDVQAILKAMNILEEHMDIVRDSPRSLYLYIRLLWVSMTGKPPFTEKQVIVLSNENWQKIMHFCKLYISNDKAQKKAFPYFLNMINAFREGNVREYKDMANINREFKKKMPAYITFAILCNEDGKPVKEDIRVLSNTSRSAEFNNALYKGVTAYFKASNFKDLLEIPDGKPIRNALIGFNMYGAVVYGESDLKLQMGGQF